MKRKIYGLCFALLIADTVMAQNINKVAEVDLGMETTTELRKTQAVSAVHADELDKNSTFNPYNTLYGLLPGLTATQRVGWWNDNAKLNIRGRGSLNGSSPLIVVDGYPRAMENINLNEIESISVLKDGAATAIWGGRGANGVVLVTTKRGKIDSKSIHVNYTYGIGKPINQPEFLNSSDYAMARNEALYYDGLEPEYSPSDLLGYYAQGNSDLYPNSDWAKSALRNHTVNNQLGITFRGGSKAIRYFSVLNYKSDMGILNKNYTDWTGRYDSQMKKYSLNVRMNLDIDVTKTTLLRLNLLGLLGEQNTPNKNEAKLFSDLYNIPSAAFPIRTKNGFWGGNNLYKRNPIADIADKGFWKLNQRLLQADARLTQDLSGVLKGLKAEVAIAYDNNAVYKEIGTKDYLYQSVVANSEGDGAVYTDYDKNTDLSINNTGLNSQYIKANFEGKVLWNNSFGKNFINASMLFRHESLVLEEQNKSKYRQYLTATAGYNYDNRYMLDIVASAFGTSILPKGDKYRFYPAVSGAWILTNEKFMKNQKTIDFLKLRASWGRSGFDDYEYDLDKQFWVGGGSYFFTKNNVSAGGGMYKDRMAMDKVKLETADKYNVGVDARLFKKLSVSADFFYDYRTNILINGDAMVSQTIGQKAPFTNDGRVETYGLEFSSMWSDHIKKDFSYYVGANFSFVRSNVLENGEEYQPYHYSSKKGKPLGQCFGLEAIGFFKDEEDIKNSPVQKFSEVRPGDIKYRDVNKDGVIDNFDRKAIGHSTMLPEVYYGLNLGFEYKNFGVDALFQGAARYSVMLNTPSVYWPLRNNTNISKWYMEDNVRWTEQTKETANMPRLTTLENKNNFQNSTQWLRSGDYFKLRNLNVYYNLPQKFVRGMHMEKVQVYARANNLFSLDHIKYMNCEDISVSYPDLASFFLGVNVKF